MNILSLITSYATLRDPFSFYLIKSPIKMKKKYLAKLLLLQINFYVLFSYIKKFFYQF